MSKHVREKQPREKINFICDFSNVLQDGEYLTSGSKAIVYRVSDNIEVSSSVILSSSYDNLNVTATTHSGSDNTGYKIVFIGNTNSGSIFEDDLFLNIKDI